MPASAQSTLLADLEITDVSFTTTGAVQVSASYLCPLGFAPDQGDTYAAVATVEQRLMDGRLARKKAFPKVNFMCDGTRRRIAVRFQTSRTGERFRQDLAVEAFMQLRLINSQGDFVVAYDEETFGRSRPLALIEIERAQLTDAGVAKVTASYWCPDGYTVASTLAEMELPNEGFEFRRFSRKIECDGTRNELAVRFHTTGPSGDPPQPGVPYAIGLGFSAAAGDDASVSAATLQTLTIQT